MKVHVTTVGDSSYVATDEDLPEIFWQNGKVPMPDGQQTGSPDAAVRSAAVMLHYPEIRIKASQRNRREAALRSEREVSLEDKKVFVKLSKKVQMWDWLRGLFEADTIGQVHAENSDAVMDFLTRMYAKFYRYSPYKCKWVTRKQYDWLQHIACHYLKVPNEH